MAKPLLMNGKPIDFSRKHPPALLKIKDFLDDNWGVFARISLIEAVRSSKDSVDKFQKYFPAYRVEGGFGNRLIFGNPKALAEYKKLLAAPVSE
jgi:hypothetical protein